MYTISHVQNTSSHCGNVSLIILTMPLGIIGVSCFMSGWQRVILCPWSTISHPTGVRMMMMAQMSHHVRKKSGVINGSNRNDQGLWGSQKWNATCVGMLQGWIWSLHGTMQGWNDGGKGFFTETRIAAYMCRYTSLNTQKSVVEPRAYRITWGNEYE